jgi:5-formyltetrahydrofolate cyclo-ligase
MTKSELRKNYLAKRGSIPPVERERLDLNIAEQFFRYFDLGRVNFLHCFLSIERLYEIDTQPIFHRVWDEFPHILTVVPRVDHHTGEMESLILSRETELSEGRWQIREPVHDETVPAKSIDMVLVPLVCFDLLGHRVGYGKGFYDRFLGKCRQDCLKVGLSYFDAVGEISDAHEGDVRLDACVTPGGVFVVNR